MQLPLLLTLFWALPTSAITFKDAVLQAMCMVKCREDTFCSKNCKNEHHDASSEEPPRLPEVANANVSLHCKNRYVISIRHNPGIYAVELSHDEGSSWSSLKASFGQFTFSENLTANHRYQFRLYRVTERGLSQPEVSPIITTDKVDHQPDSVKNISLVEFVTTESDPRFLTGVFEFTPGGDRSCYYKYKWNKLPAELRDYEFKRSSSEFRFLVKPLAYETINEVKIRGSNEDNSMESEEVSVTFKTPICVKWHRNITFCPPEKVQGLRVKETYLNGTSKNFTVLWDKPLLIPDNYTIYCIQRGKTIIEDTLPGHATEAHFENINRSFKIKIGIFARLRDANSTAKTIVIPEIIEKPTKIPKLSKDNSSFHRVVIVVSVTAFIVIFVGVIYGSIRHKKKKRRERERKYFKSRDPKVDTFEELKDALKIDYEIDTNDGFLVPWDEFKVRIETLKIKEILGGGAFGVVRLASIQDEHGRVIDVAVKMLKDNPTADSIKNFQQEMLIMKSAGDHPNVVSLMGYCKMDSDPMLIVEYCCRGDLQTYLRTLWTDLTATIIDEKSRLIGTNKSSTGEKYDNLYAAFSESKDSNDLQGTMMTTNRLYGIERDLIRHTEKVTATDLLNFGRQIASGMNFLELNRIVHRDLAARNVLVCADRTVKISDFGLSRDVYQDNVYKKQGNGMLPIKWMALESLTHHVYTIKSDVWSYGILLWEIVTLGSEPYPGISEPHKITKLLKTGYRMEKPQNCGAELYNIMLTCWHSRPLSRPTFAEIEQNLDQLLSTVTGNQYLNLTDLLEDSTIYDSLQPKKKKWKISRAKSYKYLTRPRYANEGKNLYDFQKSVTSFA